MAFRNRSGTGQDTDSALTATAIDLALYWVTSAVARALLGLRPVEDPPAARQKVHIVLMHAWGMGGTIRTSLNLAGYLAREHDVEVISVVRRRTDPMFPFPPGVRVTAIDDQRPRRRTRLRRLVRRFPGVFASRILYPADRGRRRCSLLTDVLLLRKLWRIRSGVIVGTRPALNLLALDAAKPGVAAVGAEHMHYAAHPRPTRAEIRRRYRKLDALVVLTEQDRRDYARVLGAQARVVRIPNAVAPTNGARPAHGEPVVIAAGRLTPQKGFDRLVEAFERVAPDHPEWSLHICGRGPRREALQAWVTDHDLSERVILTGAVPDLDRRLARASLFVLSSRFEGLPMVMLEAMSHGLPVVSFDCPTGPREVIRDHENGLLVPNGDVGALATAIAELMDDADERRRLGASAASTAAAYTLASVGPSWEALLRSLSPQSGGVQAKAPH